MTEAGEPAVFIRRQPQPLRGFAAPHDALEHLLARKDDAHRPFQLHRSKRSGNDFLADAELRAETAANETRDKAYVILVHVQRIGKFRDIVIEHLERSVDSQLVSIPSGDCRVRLHRGRGVALGRIGHINAVRGL